jgi:dipeptidyl aminopeptidase/acylaminoacyl peptidase
VSTDAEDHPPRDFDDVMAAYDYLKTLPYVDPDRVGIMGWSHGGFITAHLVMAA